MSLQREINREVAELLSRLKGCTDRHTEEILNMQTEIRLLSEELKGIREWLRYLVYSVLVSGFFSADVGAIAKELLRKIHGGF